MEGIERALHWSREEAWVREKSVVWNEGLRCRMELRGHEGVIHRAEAT